MGFLGIYRALYDYTPNEAGELAIKQGDLLYVLEKNDDDGWWRAKKKAGTDDEDEPTGLIPNNYVEKVSQSFATVAPVSRLPATRPRLDPSAPSFVKCWPCCSIDRESYTDLRLQTRMRMVN